MSTPYLRRIKQQRWRARLLCWVEVLGYSVIGFIAAVMWYR